MRKVFVATAVAGLLVLASIPALARTSPQNGLEAQGEAALKAIKQARATCFATLEATLDATPVADKNEDTAEAALTAAQATINAIAGPAIASLKAALEAFDEDEDDGTPASGADTLKKAIEAASKVPAAIATACTTTKASLQKALDALKANGTAAKDEDEDDDTDADRDADEHGAKKAEKAENEKAEKGDKGEKAEKEKKAHENEKEGADRD